MHCRTYRFAAYRQFIMLIYGYLGKRIREVVHSCAVSVIRKFYPEPLGIYTNYSEAILHINI